MIFSASDYREALRETLLAKKGQFGKSYSFENLAKACRVQKSYLSKVLKGNGHLSEDQLYLATEYLGLSRPQTDFLFLLRAYQQCCVQNRKTVLLEQLKRSKSQLSKTEVHISSEELSPSPEALLKYYADGSTALIHVFLSIKKFSRNPQLIRQRLGLSETIFSKCLNNLVNLGLVAIEKDTVKVIKKTLHLTSDSDLFPIWRNLVRLRALERLSAMADEDAYSFSVFFSANEATRGRLKAKFLEFLQEVKLLAQNAPSEEVYQLNFDLIGW